MKRLTEFISGAFIFVSLSAFVFANDAEIVVDAGELNPEELSIDYFAAKLESGKGGPMAGIHGYAAAKAGDFKTARRIFEILGAQGNAQAMTWMSWLDDNGLGAPENPEAAARWDRRAMQLGDSVGTFNYGLDLLRGRGVAKDVHEGRRLIDRAAALGDTTAKALMEAGYDLDVVTPDADNWKYNPFLY